MPEDQVDLIDLVFSWSLEDILNHDLLRDEVCLFFFFFIIIVSCSYVLDEIIRKVCSLC